MIRIFGRVKNADLRSYIIRNGGSGAGTLGDAWRRYLHAHSGIGTSFYSLEKSWLAAQGYTTYQQFAHATGVDGKNAEDSIRQGIRK